MEGGNEMQREGFPWERPRRHFFFFIFSFTSVPTSCLLACVTKSHLS